MVVGDRQAGLRILEISPDKLVTLPGTNHYTTVKLTGITFFFMILESKKGIHFKPRW